MTSRVHEVHHGFFKKSITAHYVLERVRVHHCRERQQLPAFAVVKEIYGNVFNSE